MNFYNKIFEDSKTIPIFPQVLLIILASLLLGIWATRNTIAIRNILLVIGSLIGIISSARWYKSKGNDFFLSLDSYVAPLIIFVGLLIWVVAHYFFINQGQSLQQLKELKGTWVRVFMASILGVSAGLVVAEKNKLMHIMWLGILISFIVLLAQYIPDGIKNVYSPNFFKYIYILKINGVLMGLIFISNAVGFFMDRNKFIKSYEKKLFIYYWFGFTIIIYSFIFIFDSRIGVGIASLLFIFWLIFNFQNFISIIKKPNKIFDNRLYILLYLAFFITLILGIISHYLNNPGWRSIFADIYLGMHPYQYPNWMNEGLLGHPVDATGRIIISSAYERTAIFVAGINLLFEDFWGGGVLLGAFPQAVHRAFQDLNLATAPSSHSGWIEFGLAYGLIGMILIISILIFNIINSIKIKSSNFFRTKIIILVTFLLLYTIGELSNAHGLEVYFFMMSLIAGLNIAEIYKFRILKNYKC